MLYAIKKQVAEKPHKYPDPVHMNDLLDFTLLGQCEYHHSDDFQSYLLIPTIPILALYDNVRHYAKFHALKLKFELVAASPGNNYGGCPPNLNELIPKKIASEFFVNAGSPVGDLLNDRSTFEPVSIYDYQTRLKLQFKSPYTVVEYTDDFPCGRIVRAGAEFLRQYLKLPDDHEQFGETWVIPLREVGRLMAKLKLFPQKTLDHFEVLQKLICCGYSCAGNPELHKRVSLIFHEYREHYKLSLDDVVAGIQSLPDKKTYKHKLGNLTLVERATFPDYIFVCQFVSADKDTKNKYKHLIKRSRRNDYKNFDPVARAGQKPNISAEPVQKLREIALAQMALLKEVALANDGNLNNVLVARHNFRA